jgi:hypothetical protein
MKLSPKHGVNATIPVCFWCGKPKNEIALMGQLKDDAEAPRNAVFDYEPCDACKSERALGIALVEVTEDAPSPSCRPTGNWCVIKEEGLRRILTGEDNAELRASVLKTRIANVPVDAYKMLMGPAK